MVAACLALIVNFPGLKYQQDQLALHAPPILAMSSLIFAAGVFTGVLIGTGMANAVATGLLESIPDSFGPFMAVLTALLSIPVTWFRMMRSISVSCRFSRKLHNIMGSVPSRWPEPP